MKRLKLYKPIKVHHLKFGFGWWFGKRVYFISKHSTTFAIVPLSFICTDSIYASNGNIIGHGDCDSWSEIRQKENNEKK